MKLCVQLFVTFFKVGLFTFGGGWAMIAVMQREIVERHKWLDDEQFLDLLTVAQSMPGILAVNIATVIGDKLRGLKGGVSAALGTIIPSFCIILAIAIFLTPEMIKNNDVVNRIFKGLRPAVVALIVVPVITTARSAKINYKTVIIPIIVAIMVYSGIPYISNPILYIVIGALVGILVYANRLNNKRKEGEK
ncbi:MAG: chromate transporter [Bacteroidales bacterium]|nr:chromate transporter [Candidatus Sodaliphilus aphodohippi]